MRVGLGVLYLDMLDFWTFVRVTWVFDYSADALEYSILIQNLGEAYST